MVTSWIRRQFKNGVITTATTTMSSGATSFTVNTGAGSTFPDGSVGPFIVTVDQGQAAEEKILITSRSTDTFTVAASGRGYNGTSASAHTNAFVLHTIDQQDLDEANQVANQTLGAIAASGDLLVGSAANTLAKLSRGSSGQFLQAGASTLSWGNAADKSSASTQAFTGAISATSYAGAVAATTITASSTIIGSSTSQGTALIASGLTGATAASRYVGATASGAPGSGTFSTGDFVIDQTGVVWVCTAGGSPGTWGQVGGASDTSWTNISVFTNSWAAGGTQPRYRKTNGIVFLQGVISGGTGATTAFTLPAGYRPTETCGFTLTTGIGATSGNMNVNTDGTVVPTNSVAYNITCNFSTL